MRCSPGSSAPSVKRPGPRRSSGRRSACRLPLRRPMSCGDLFVLWKFVVVFFQSFSNRVFEQSVEVVSMQ